MTCVSATHGQSRTRIEGTVLDQSGATIADATVTLFSDDRVRTSRADHEGWFVFPGLTAPAHYIEASSNGFFSSSIPLTDKTSRPVTVVLRVGESNGQCLDIPDDFPRAIYEKRSGNVQLAGRVVDFSGPHLAGATLTLRRAEFATPLVDTQSMHPSPSMRRRQFNYSLAAITTTNIKGEYQFTDLEPGWYSLEAALESYRGGTIHFWIARDNLTKPADMNLVLKSIPFIQGSTYCETILGPMPEPVYIRQTPAPQ